MAGIGSSYSIEQCVFWVVAWLYGRYKKCVLSFSSRMLAGWPVVPEWFVCLCRGSSKYGSGCELVEDRCVFPSSSSPSSATSVDSNHFCVPASASEPSFGCTQDLMSYGLCELSTFNGALPSWGQYFSGGASGSPSIGGGISLLDYCPAFQMFTFTGLYVDYPEQGPSVPSIPVSTDCTRTHNNVDSLQFRGAVFGDNSRCILGNLVRNGFVAQDGDDVGMCYDVACNVPQEHTRDGIPLFDFDAARFDVGNQTQPIANSRRLNKSKFSKTHSVEPEPTLEASDREHAERLFNATLMKSQKEKNTDEQLTIAEELVPPSPSSASSSSASTSSSWALFFSQNSTVSTASPSGAWTPRRRGASSALGAAASAAASYEGRAVAPRWASTTISVFDGVRRRSVECTADQQGQQISFENMNGWLVCPDVQRVCHSGPCRHGGVPRLGVCVCQPGFVGKFCEQPASSAATRGWPTFFSYGAVTELTIRKNQFLEGLAPTVVAPPIGLEYFTTTPLPEGLALNATTGVIRGTPTQVNGGCLAYVIVVRSASVPTRETFTLLRLRIVEEAAPTSANVSDVPLEWQACSVTLDHLLHKSLPATTTTTLPPASTTSTTEGTSSGSGPLPGAGPRQFILLLFLPLVLHILPGP
eukprot:GHVT01008292.1.p1 GENE.GHVT01008292.1~~GHVT01008292.1.p1  ORF type:complete len:642 (+),score=130.24 GHVT01008292.1:697-2622(+)